MRSERRSKLHAHVAQHAETHHADFFRMDSENKALIDDDAVGKGSDRNSRTRATVGHACEAFVREL
jgi:hypothetical protein